MSETPKSFTEFTGRVVEKYTPNGCKELWGTIPGLDGLYEASNLGRIRNAKTRYIRSTPTGKRGYPVFTTRGRLITVHRCVALVFLPNPDNLPQVNHINGNKEDNRVENLEWCTARDNMIHARLTGLHKSDGDKPVLQIKDGQVVAWYKSISEASRQTGINRANIGSAIYKRVYNGHHCRKAGGYEWKFE
jgi:hypothetical protein